MTILPPSLLSAQSWKAIENITEVIGLTFQVLAVVCAVLLLIAKQNAAIQAAAPRRLEPHQVDSLHRSPSPAPEAVAPKAQAPAAEATTTAPPTPALTVQPPTLRVFIFAGTTPEAGAFANEIAAALSPGFVVGRGNIGLSNTMLTGITFYANYHDGTELERRLKAANLPFNIVPNGHFVPGLPVASLTYFPDDLFLIVGPKP